MSGNNATVRVREPQFADGMWYSARAEALADSVRGYLAEAPAAIDPDALVGLVAPHAGHRFSGHVAGAAFGALTPGYFNTVILLGPDHRGAAPSRTSTPNVAAWQTPLGQIPVAWELLNPLKKSAGLTLLEDDHEHALEIELPFLQLTLQSFRLVPLLMGSQARTTCQQLSLSLLAALDEAQGDQPRALFVASSDLSHFFEDAEARRLDNKTLDYILNLDPHGLLDYVARGNLRGQPLACGAGPIATVMMAARARGATQARLLKYATSADAHPDRSRVVGYAAIAFTR